MVDASDQQAEMSNQRPERGAKAPSVAIHIAWSVAMAIGVTATWFATERRTTERFLAATAYGEKMRYAAGECALESAATSGRQKIALERVTLAISSLQLVPNAYTPVFEVPTTAAQCIHELGRLADYRSAVARGTSGTIAHLKSAQSLLEHDTK